MLDADAVDDAVGNGNLAVSATPVTNAVIGVRTIGFNTAGSDNTFATGDAVTATVTFSEAVTVDTTGGTPQLTIDVGGTDKVLNYASGTGTAALVFSGYTVAANDEDTDGLSVATNKLDANDGTIKATAGDNPDAVLAHAAVAASANHKVDGVKPTLSSAEASSDLSKIVLTFSEAIGSVDRTKITLMSGTNTLTATADSISGTKVEITLTTALTTSDTMVTVALAAGAVADVPGNGIAAVSATTVSIVDTTAPTLKSAQIVVNTRITLVFDEALDSTSLAATSAFTVKVEGNSRTVSSRQLVDSNEGIRLDVSGPVIRPGETVTVSYTKPGTNPLKDAADNEVASFTDFSVENLLAATAPEAPPTVVVADITVFGTANEYGDQLGLFWTTPWHNGSPIEKHQYRYAAGTTIPPATTWTDIPDSTPSGQHSDNYTVEGLEPGTQYTFEVRAVNGIGNGAGKTAMDTTLAPNWSFALRDSSDNNVTELTEGGDSATAEVSITNNVRFSAEQTVTLEWGGAEISSGLIQGAGGSATFTIAAEQASGSLTISAPDPGDSASYEFPTVRDLTATHGTTEIGLISLGFVDDEPRPVASITEAPAAVDEGDAFDVEITLTPAFSASSAFTYTVEFSVTDTDSVLSGPPRASHFSLAGRRRVGSP